MRKELAIITTHPIQYNAPLFKLLEERNIIKPVVYYTWGESVLHSKFDPGFGKAIDWDIPLIDGYESHFPENVSSNPGSTHFKGIDNPGLIKQLEELNPDAILVYGWNFKSHLKIMRHFHGKIPILFRGDSTMMKERGIRKLVKRLVLAVVYRNADYFLYAGKKNMEYFKMAGIGDQRLIFMPHAIDNSRFADPAFDTEAIQFRTELGIPGEAIVFLYAGKLDHNKNVKVLIQAFRELKNSGMYLIIAGDGPCKQELVNMADSVRNIIFLPFQNQARMPVIYRAGDVFVLPSLSETWGLAINEAFACGRPVICSDACGAAIDLVINSDTGFLFRSNNIDDLKRALELLNDKKLSRAMGQNASRLISGWNYEEAAKAVEQLTIHAVNSHQE